jgi:hypothetical protein
MILKNIISLFVKTFFNEKNNKEYNTKPNTERLKGKCPLIKKQLKIIRLIGIIPLSLIFAMNDFSNVIFGKYRIFLKRN